MSTNPEKKKFYINYTSSRDYFHSKFALTGMID